MAANDETETIAGRAGIVGAGTLASRILGLVREQSLAAMFSRAQTDTFFIAFLIPNMLRQLVAEGATQNAVLPVLAQVKEQHGPTAARDLYHALRGALTLLLFALTVAGVLLAPSLVELFASGFHQHPGQFERTVLLTRVTFPYVLFMGSFALGAAALNVHQRFTAAAFAPALLNLAFIAAALVLAPALERRGIDSIVAMSGGALLGGALQVAALWPSLKRIGYGLRARLDFSNPGVRDVFRRMGPVLFGVGIYYVDVIVARRFLADLEVGAQSHFGFALRLCDFPQGIFVMAIQTASLPSLAALYAKGDQAELSRTFAFGVRLASFVALAASVLFVVLAEPLVTLIFQRGRFDAVSAHETARALVAQGAGIWTVAMVRQLVVVYYAVGDTRTPVLVSALDFGVFLLLALALRGSLGHVGISWAVTGASAAQMLLLLAGLRRHLKIFPASEILESMARTLLATVPAAATGWLTARAISGLGLHLPGLLAALAFVIVFLLSSRILKCQELTTLLSVLKRLKRESS